MEYKALCLLLIIVVLLFVSLGVVISESQNKFQNREGYGLEDMLFRGTSAKMSYDRTIGAIHLGRSLPLELRKGDASGDNFWAGINGDEIASGEKRPDTIVVANRTTEGRGNGTLPGDTENGRIRADEYVNEQSEVCWSAAAHGGYGDVNGMNGVTAVGRGCRECLAGDICSFAVRILPPAQWSLGDQNYSTGLPFKKEIMVTLEGPSLVHGYITVDPQESRALIVVYRTWDAGVYRVRMRAACGNLNYTESYQQLHGHQFATWNLTVKPSIFAPSPCSHSLHARWLLVNGLYRWEPYNCSIRAPVGGIIRMMHDKGIREINFVGDSHQRTLFHHMYALITGITDQTKAGWHGDLNYTARQGILELKMNYYWQDGIYTNNEAGCRHRGTFSKRRSQFPNISITADVTILNAGHWTWYQCPVPERTWAAKLPSYLDWSQANTTKKAGSKTIYRSSTTWASDKFGCSARTNANFAWANMVARGLLERYDIHYFDGWQVEAPRYLDTCSNRDFHYSCYKPEMSGAVGEALALSLMHYLVNNI